MEEALIGGRSREFKYAAAYVLRKPKEEVTKSELNRMKRAWAYLSICQKARVDRRSWHKHHPQKVTSFIRSNRFMGTNLVDL